ncbi:MAG TPA: pyridoxamine 5'-phosphate oxidase family protein, partial [Solirubrobacteraceae bacterium]|nr:pyridoxamine 5'-phosphate oxidase family protein [Solirubrobacteraceae bacterium]
MSDAEVAAFLAEERTVTCATLGPHGWPHLMPLWYVLRAAEPGAVTPATAEPATAEPAAGAAPLPGPRVWAWTYAASQKVRNLERDARATLQVEAGESFELLRGVMLECEVLVHRELEVVRAL